MISYRCPLTFLVLSATAALPAQTATPAKPEVKPPADPIAVLEKFVTTATRSAVAITDVPTRIEVVTAADIAATPGFYVTDALKKNASVDIIQYPGGLSGVGIRGYRPELGGTAQRTLLLIDGRPAGATNFGNIPNVGIDRIEVLKGPASSLYGASAMSGVVNLITRRSSGPIKGHVTAGYGSLQTLVADAAVGGSAGGFDFDLAASTSTQFQDFTMGNGQVLNHTAFNAHSGYARLGRKLSDAWRIDGSLTTFLTWGTKLPGMYSDGLAGRTTKNVAVSGGDVRLEGNLGPHSVRGTVYAAAEYNKNFQNPITGVSFRDTIRDTTFKGVQVQDSWRAFEGTGRVLEQVTVIYGSDYQEITNENLRYNATGARIAPTANDTTETFGFFADAAGKFFSNRVVFNAGIRHDLIDLTLEPTPLRTDITPGTSRVTTTNPRTGIVYTPFTRWRLHATAGRGFVNPLATQLAGLTTNVINGQRQISYGNPNLKPEAAWSYDGGIGYDSRLISLDATWYYTEVTDKIENVFPVNTPALRESTFINASTAHSSGLELTWAFDLGAMWGEKGGTWRLTGGYTHQFQREQKLPAGTLIIRNVAKDKLNAAVVYTGPRLSVHVNARYVRGFWDQDFSRLGVYTNGRGGIFEEAPKAVWDLTTSYRVTSKHIVSLAVNNVFDRFYYEKGDYPLAGRTFIGRYRFEF